MLQRNVHLAHADLGVLRLERVSTYSSGNEMRVGATAGEYAYQLT